MHLEGTAVQRFMQCACENTRGCVHHIDDLSFCGDIMCATNHNSTDVTSDVILTKIELMSERNVHKTQKYFLNTSRVMHNSVYRKSKK